MDTKPDHLRGGARRPWPRPGCAQPASRRKCSTLRQRC